MMKIKGMSGILKGAAGLIFIAVFAALVVFFVVIPAFAAHTTSTTVTPATVDQSQNVTLNFTITPSITGGTNVTNITINFTAAGWTVPTTNTSIVCPLVNSEQWNATVGADVIACVNGSITGNASAAVFVAVKGATLAPATTGAKTFVINTTDLGGGIANSSATVTVLGLSANMTINDTAAQISSQKSYSFSITNNGTDDIKGIYIGYTNWTNDTVAANVTCPSIGGAWTKSVDTTNDRIGCYADAGQTNLAAGASTTVTVSNWIAMNVAGGRNFSLTVQGNANGNYTETLAVPNINVFGTATTTGIDNASSARAISSTLVDVLRINISAAGENINVSSINLVLSGTVQAADIVGVMIYNETTPLGALIMVPIGGNNTQLGAAGGNVTIVFTLPSPGWLIPNGTSNLSRIVLNISTAATGGRTFTANLTGAANISMTGQTSGRAITTGGSFPIFANTTTIFGNLSVVTGDEVVTGNTVALANAINFTTLQFNLTAQGEAVNSITMTINTTATVLGDLSTLMVYNDTGCDGGPVTSSDKLINATSAAPTASQAIRLGNATYNESVGAGITRCFLVAYNVSVGPAGGNTFQTILAGNSGAGTGASSAQSITSYGGSSLQSTAAEIQGNVTVAIANKATSTVVINTVNYTTLMVNLTANGENITQIRFIVNTQGTAIVSNATNPLMIARDNNTNGIFDGTGTDTVLNSTLIISGTAPTVFLVNASANETIANGTTTSYLIMYNVRALGGGDKFTTTLAPSNITAQGGVSNNTLTGLGTAANSSLVTIFGNFSIDGVNTTRSAVNTNATNFAILKLNFTATAENMTIEQINITLNATTNGDITAAQLYNDTNNNSVLDASEPVAGPAATISGNVIRFGTTGTPFFTVPNGTVVGVILVVNVSNSAAGLNTIDAHLAAAANVTVKGNQSLSAITPLGSYSIDPAGFANVRPLSGIGNLTVATAQINSQISYSFIVNNTAGDFAGDRISEIMINYSGRMNDTVAGNVTCPTFLGVTWNKTVDTTNDIITCNSTGPNNILNPANSTSPNATVIVSNWVAPGTAGVNTIPVIVRGNAGNGTKNVSSNPSITVFGTLSMTLANKATSTVQINTTNYALAMINLTPTGEGVFNPIFAFNLTAVAGNVTALTIYNNTACDGSTQGAVLGVNTTSAALNGTATTVANTTLAAGQNTCFIVAVNVSAQATGGNTITLAMAANNITATGLSSSVTNITATGNNSQNSTATEIYGNVTIASVSLAPTRISAGQDSVTMLYLNITAQGEALNITAINITLNGTANQTNLSQTNGVRIYNDTNGNLVFNGGTDTNLSTANTTLNGTAQLTANLTLTNGTQDTFIIPRGATRTIFVVYNISSFAQNGSTMGATVERANNVHLIGSVSGIEINPLSGVPVASSNTTITSAAALTVSSIAVTQTNVSQSQTRIQAVVKVQNTGNTTANITLVNLTFHRNASSANTTDTANYTIESTNTSSPATITGGTTTDYNITFNISSTAALGIVYINATVTGTDGNSGASLSAAGAVGTVDSFDVESQANLAVGTVTVNTSWIKVNQSVKITIPLSNSANSSAVSFGRTLTILNQTNVSSNASFTITQDDSNTTARGYAATTQLTYNLTLTGTLTENIINLNVSVTYNDNNTALASANSPAAAYQGTVFRVDSTVPAFSAASLNTSFIQTAASIRFNVSITDFAFNSSAVNIVVLNATNATVNVTSVTCSADASNLYNCTVSWNGTGINATGNAGSTVPDGAYRFSVNSTDNASNAANTNSSSFTVDNTGPTFAGERRTDGHINSSQTSVFYVNVTDLSMNTSNVRIELVNSSGTINTSIAATCTALASTTYNCSATWNGTNNTGGRTEGNVTFRINVTDNASLTTSFTSNVSVFVDDTAPSASITTPSNGAIIGANVSVNFTLNDTVSGINQSLMVFQINATTFTSTCSSAGLNYACNFTWVTTNGSWPDGTYNVTVLNITDNSSNLGSQAQITVTVDNSLFETNGTSPTGTINETAIPAWVNTTEPATCKFDTSDKQYNSMTFTMNGSGTTSHNYTLTGLLDGVQQTRYVKCRDSANNQTSTQIAFTVDTRTNFGVIRPTPTVLGAYFLNNSWNSFDLPLWELQNRTSLTVYNVTTVLTNLNNTYARLYYYNGTGWQSYTPGDAVNSFVNFTDNSSASNYYILPNQTNRRIQLSR